MKTFPTQAKQELPYKRTHNGVFNDTMLEIRDIK